MRIAQARSHPLCYGSSNVNGIEDYEDLTCIISVCSVISLGFADLLRK